MALYEVPEKPSDALSYLRNNFVGQNVKELQDTNDTLKAQNAELVFSNFFVNSWGFLILKNTIYLGYICFVHSYFCFDVDINHRVSLRPK